MKEMSKRIDYNGKSYRLDFNLNVMEEIQEEYGTIEHWGDLTDGTENGEPNAKAVIFGFTAMMNEGIDIDNEENGTDIKPLTPKQVGRIVTGMGLINAATELNNIVIDSTKDDDEKNA